MKRNYKSKSLKSRNLVDVNFFVWVFETKRMFRLTLSSTWNTLTTRIPVHLIYDYNKKDRKPIGFYNFHSFGMFFLFTQIKLDILIWERERERERGTMNYLVNVLEINNENNKEIEMNFLFIYFYLLISNKINKIDDVWKSLRK
jgi:hypothetical protein